MPRNKASVRTEDALHTDMIFKDGDGPEPGLVSVGHSDEDVGLHLNHHADTGGDPFASVYLDPVGAGILGARLLVYARKAQDS